jgi:hypothetical protein
MKTQRLGGIANELTLHDPLPDVELVTGALGHMVVKDMLLPEGRLG